MLVRFDAVVHWADGSTHRAKLVETTEAQLEAPMSVAHKNGVWSDCAITKIK